METPAMRSAVPTLPTTARAQATAPHSYVWYDTTGTHIAVLLNQNDANATSAARALYCHA
jgi:hypothetical protein